MRKIAFALAAGVALTALSPAMAQEAAAPAEAPAAAPAETAAPVGVPTASATHMLAGAEVRMTTRGELSSRTSLLGDRFELEVTDDVAVNGLVMIPRGSVATGEVTRVRKKGGWGRSGILETRLISVRVGDRQIRLQGAAGDRGRAGTAAVVGAVLLSPLIVAPFVGFFVTGTSAVVPAQTVTVGYTDEEMPLEFAVAPGTMPAVETAAPPTAAEAAIASPGEPVPDPAPAETPQGE